MKSFVKFGLVTGLIVSAWNLSCFTIVSWLNKILSLGFPAARIRAYSGLFGIVILLIGVSLGIKEVKRRNGYRISFVQAIKTGISISLISASISGFFAFVYCTVINPGYTDYMVKQAESALMQAHKTPEEIRQTLLSVRNQFSTLTQVFQALVAQSIMGTLGSVIIGLFTKTKKIN